MTSRLPKKSMTAAEFAAFQRKAMRDDREHLARVKEQDAEVERAAKAKADAERPVVDDLRAAGVKVRTLYGELPERTLSKALPVLVEHLERDGYPDDILSVIGNHLSVRAAVMYWHRLMQVYLNSSSEAQEKAAAYALAGSATKDHYDQLVHLLGLEERGESRIAFLGPIRTLGRERGWEVIESVRDHPLLGTEASAMLRKRKSR
jgi:hypothetical protein